ncbi:Guanylate kinase [Candidatus Westeberhardia cardiocondylae]|uniref:Guanylate kinase n=1 Tax=Candidatus Westeberhardia cardiocondylae TaxID=1594731 RepID=A0A0H5BWP2_9ENTR|nr:guanylate kinase [Candidatus Westeberhardia cardiocondylae]CEN32088.1 Guanylate kinase [Candidatus Westeberhardia cardiocondylae]
MFGTLYIVSAPSGVGKTSLLHNICANKLICDITLSISYTTREMRLGEFHKKHYFFVSKQKFKDMIRNNFFLEYAKVFDNYYGTSKAEIRDFLSSGMDVLLDIDWQGAQQIRYSVPNSCSIFIFPPSIKELNRRLYRRKKDDKIIIKKRMLQAVKEMNHYMEYDYLIFNDCFDVALRDLRIIIESERLRVDRQKLFHGNLIKELLKKLN